MARSDIQHARDIFNKIKEFDRLFNPKTDGNALPSVVLDDWVDYSESLGKPLEVVRLTDEGLKVWYENTREQGRLPEPGFELRAKEHFAPCGANWLKKFFNVEDFSDEHMEYISACIPSQFHPSQIPRPVMISSYEAVGYGKAFLVPKGKDPLQIPLDVDNEWEILSRKLWEDTRSKLEKREGKVLEYVLQCYVISAYEDLRDQWYEAVSQIAENYIKHDNHCKDRAGRIKGSPHIPSRCWGYVSLNFNSDLYILNVKRVENYLDRIATYFTHLEPVFGDLRAILQKKASKRCFRDLMNILTTMDKDEVFYNQILPYVKDYIDRNYRVSDRELSTTDKYDVEVLENFMKVFKVKSLKAYEQFRTGQIVGSPEVLVMDWGRGYYSNLRWIRASRDHVYESVKVIVIRHAQGIADALRTWPLPEQVPNLETIYYPDMHAFFRDPYLRGVRKSDLEELYGKDLLQPVSNLTKAINDHFK